MHRITLEQIFKHHITQKYVNRSGMVHAIAVAYHAFHLAKSITPQSMLPQKLASFMISDIIRGTQAANGIMTYIKRMISMQLKALKEHINYLLD